MSRASCPECPHCQAITRRSDLRLPAAAPRSVPGEVDRAFYRAFADAYGRARGAGARPMSLLREANPGLTPARCDAYLRRARQLGYVAAPAREARPGETAPGSGGPVVTPTWTMPDDEQARQRVAAVREYEAQLKAEQVARWDLDAGWLADCAGFPYTRAELAAMLEGEPGGADVDGWMQAALDRRVLAFDSRSMRYTIRGRHVDVAARTAAPADRHDTARSSIVGGGGPIGR
jgi:hypothetical protein